MKKTVSVLASFALASSASMVALPTAASAQGASNLVEFCQFINEIFPDVSVGECVSANRTWVVQYCKDLDDIGFFPVTLADGTVIRNQGNCIALFRPDW